MSIEPRFKDADAVREAIVTIACNWRDEWIAFLGEIAKSRYFRRPSMAVLTFGSADIALKFVQDGEAQELGRAPRQPDTTEMTALVASLAASHGVQDVCLQFPQASVLRAALRLPQTSHANLRNALGFELSRLSPVEPDRLYFDYEITNRDKMTNRADIALRIIKRDIVDSAIETCHAAGLQTSAILFENDKRPADWRYFPIDRNAYLRLLWARWNLLVLGALTVLLAFLVLVTAYGRNADVLDRLDSQVAEQAQQVAQITHLRDDIAYTNMQAQFLAEQKQAPMFIAVLAEITDIVPVGAWLTNLQVNGGRVHIQGYAHSASDLIGRIDKSKLFANAQFEAPVVQDTAEKAERFSISFLIVKGAR